MRAHRINCGYVPLVDSAPLIIARELNFAQEEGLDLQLLKQPSWSALRDLLALGHLDAAHILSPLPIAMSLGLGGLPAQVDALMVLSANGNVIGVSNTLADQMRENGWSGDFLTPSETGKHLIASAGPDLRIGVPFPFSMHSELLYYWLGHLGIDVGNQLDIRIVPPPQMADAIAQGEIDVFCVGEPWGSIAVEQGVAELILPGAAIWAFAPEKVLAARRDWITTNPDLTRRLMRAVARAAKWLGDHDNRMMAAEVLARSEHLDVADDIIDRALAGRLIMRRRAFAQQVPHFLRFHGGAANFPWRSQAAWIASNLAGRMKLDRSQAIQIAKSCFRADLYRDYLSEISVDMPGASEKLEGALVHPEAVASERGELILGPDAFFDGQIFDPNAAG
ncbi:CmpA/NrtA family ABC transporter substrate-binding protein [Pseudaestuariivita rosea]|uniref:CmpA/NrtA family ABC transporter substrate-binding protein n=1 Tax=Pseudaestuariivita rosea TaxID=2763263 RepID=UPI001ABB6175|nr:CmpA/NrtA family ABC transporter substrate-binding protein [Pseudaestuariivita rosea]